MQAVVLTDNGKLELAERPDPTADSGRAGPDPAWSQPVLIRVAAVGICGSDIPRAFADKAYHYPLVLGHEFAGTVVETPGAEDEGALKGPRFQLGAAAPPDAERSPPEAPFQAGDRVAVFPLIPRPDDPMTQIGEYAVSSGYDYFGSRRDGGFQEYLWVPAANLVRVPEDVPLLSAALTEPAAVALHAVRRLGVEAGGTAVVIGGGPIGTLAAQWLRILGADRVIVSEVDPRKLEILRELELETIDAGSESVEDAVAERTGGRGAQWVIEAVGIPATFLQALNVGGVFAKVVLMGNIAGTLELPEKVVSSILRRELTIYGTWNSKLTPRGMSEWDTVLQHMGRDLHIAPIISHTEPLERAPELLSAMAERSIWFNRAVLVIDREAAGEP
ncbi:MAG: zinc-binding dehydrogenase [Spirochaetes bacterium]|jgi:L-iditol 2-dehydrogenase/galactitol-1-phosphate 5-dehydrogenase|nr:zinc-binding dehydrogenase [Spirochaetota bacterium]